MNNRYKIPKKDQILYLNHVTKTSALSSDQLAKTFHVSSRTYRDWKRGKFSLPVDVVSTIEKKWGIPFPLLKKQAIHEWKITRTKNARRGGYAKIQKYGQLGTAEGRRKGGIHGMETLRKLHKAPLSKIFTIPPHSIKLAEFVGIMLGDGHVGDEQWSITLNAIKDKKYVHYCVQLILELFQFQPKVLHRSSSHVLIIYGGGKSFIHFLRSIGLTAKNKIKEQIGVPEWIHVNSNFCAACVCGLMDTDGGIFKHHYMVNKKIYSYTKLCFTNRSIPLLHFVYHVLLEYRMNPKLIEHVANKKVWLYNQQEVIQYLSLIGTHNPRLLVNVGG